MPDLDSLSTRPDRLLHTKLMPPRLRPSTLPRQDLLSRLDGGLAKKLICVAAPTGFGKTTLISQWIARRDLATAWVTLDESDNDPARFWTYAITALHSMDPSLGKASLAALTTPQVSYQAVLTPLINEIAGLTQPAVLVLEDYQLITSPEVNEAVAFLLHNLPENLHLVVIARSQPDLPLAILRARDELLEIDAEGLRFTPAETEVFLHIILGTGLSPGVLESLQARTEGWAAGLRLAALYLQNQGDLAKAEETIQGFSGGHRFVADYMIQEVFERQAPSTQSLLLKTCFLNRLTASLCDALTGESGSAQVLEQLERDGLFLVQLQQSGGRIWYRYNPLFAESIQYLARQRLDEASLDALYARASEWYELNQMYAEAIETALSAGLYPRALVVIEKYLEIHDISELLTLERWLEQVPEEVIFQHPEICFMLAQVILYTKDRYSPAMPARLEPLLHAAQEAWQSSGNHARHGELLSLRGIIAWWQGDLPKAFEYARRSLQEIPEHHVLWRGNSLLILAYEELNRGRILSSLEEILEAQALLGAAQNIHGVLACLQILSEIFFWQGDLEGAGQLSRQILDEAIGGEEMLDDQGIAWLNLGNIAYEQNDLETAEQYAGRALDLAKKRANQMLQVQAAVRLADILAARDDPSGALELLKALEPEVKNPLLRQIQSAKARISIRAGEIDGLEWWLALIEADKQVLPAQREQEAFILAHLRIAESRADEALEALSGWEQDAAENGRLRSQVEAVCLKALAHYAGSDPDAAAEELSRALETAREKGFIRLLLDLGGGMAELLQAVIPRLARRSLVLYATTLLHSFSTEAISQPASATSGVLVEPLSPQEQRVLRLLAAGLSNPEIARELFVSLNTIKTQVKSIYRKLNVSSRDEASQVARDLNLL
jgi:LuxR family maltose regulon positive regulatory protein